MELRHLRYFVAVAEALHVTRAAERLGIAQPPLTQQIRALERELGAALLVRAGRGIALTEAGRLFLGEARAILAHADAAAALARRAARGEAGRLRLGFTESASFEPLVTGAIRAFRARYPEVDLALEEQPSAALAERLRDKAIDLAFLRPPLPGGGSLTFTPLVEAPMLAALPAGHPLAARACIGLAELAADRFILYPRTVRPGLSDLVVEACRAAGFAPILGQEAPQLSATVNFVAAGFGIAIVPAAMRCLRPEGISYVALAPPVPMAVLGMAVGSGSPEPAIENFCGLAKALAAG